MNTEEILHGLETWVAVESPTYDQAGVNRMMDLAQSAMGALGATLTRHQGLNDYGDCVLARMPWGGAGPGILVLAHLDTVHAVGSTTGSVGLRRDGDRVYGPGICDMKGGAYIAVCALRQIVESSGATPLPISFLFVPDEEIGSPSTRDLIEAEARRSHYVLVPEPAREGNLITGRWGFQRFTLIARGDPAHAGIGARSGRSAIREVAEQVVKLETTDEFGSGVTFSCGVIHGGRFVNVVPEICQLEVLVVASSQESFVAVRRWMLDLESIDPDVRLVVTPGPVRPVYEESEGGLALYDIALGIAREIGFEPGHVSVGGGSDGNFTGALGVPTLDGLGVCGGGIHTAQEHIFASTLVPRMTLLGELYTRLQAP